jgi:hypothetical protein
MNQLPSELPNGLPNVPLNVTPNGLPNVPPNGLPNGLPNVPPNELPNGLPNMPPNVTPNVTLGTLSVVLPGMPTDILKIINQYAEINIKRGIIHNTIGYTCNEDTYYINDNILYKNRHIMQSCYKFALAQCNNMICLFMYNMYNTLVIYDINNPDHYIRYHLKCAILNIQYSGDKLFIEWPNCIKSYKINCKFQLYEAGILQIKGKLLYTNSDIVIISTISRLQIYNCNLKYLGKITLPYVTAIIYDKKYMAYNTLGHAFDLDLMNFTAVLNSKYNVSYAIL